jgi:hypothetical protein
MGGPFDGGLGGRRRHDRRRHRPHLEHVGDQLAGLLGRDEPAVDQPTDEVARELRGGSRQPRCDSKLHNPLELLSERRFLPDCG